MSFAKLTEDDTKRSEEGNSYRIGGSGGWRDYLPERRKPVSTSSARTERGKPQTERRRK